MNHTVSRRVEFLLLAVVLLLTAVLRTSFPSLTEFKADEARLTLLALEMAEGTAFHIRGISSSVGFPNFPMSVWLYSLPLLIWKHVYAATIFTGLLNTLAVLGSYWLVRRYYGVEAALVAALMFAVSPWAIHHSRKIWAQNLLPFFVVGWGISAALAFVEQRKRWLIVHFLALAIAVQIHLAAVALVPVTGLLLLIFWRRLDWKLTAVSITLAALTTVPFLYYLLTQGQQFLSGGGGIASVSDGRGWDFSAFRMAWLLTSGKEIHALAGAEQFRNYLATVPDLTAVYLLWGVLITGGIALLFGDWGSGIRDRKSHSRSLIPDPRSREREFAFILLLWLFVPMLLFSLPFLPSELHYLLPIYPVPFMAAGIAVARLPRRWRRGVQAVIILSAIAQIFVWGQLLSFVSQTATPGGVGTPLAMKLEATDLARTWLAETEAMEILIAGDGERPLLDEFPAVYDVLLHDVPHRFVGITQTAVFPATPSIILLDPQGDGATLYQQAATESETIPLRVGEGELQILQLQGETIAPQHPIDPPQILSNWAAIAGYDGPIAHADGTATWRLYWYAGEAAAIDFHLFTHLLDENGERIGGTDTAVFDANQWRQGDLVVSTMRMEWPDETATVRTGMYVFPELTAVSLYDVAGNLAGESLEIPLP